MAAHYRRQVAEGEKVWAPAMCAENRVAYAQDPMCGLYINCTV